MKSIEPIIRDFEFNPEEYTDAIKGLNQDITSKLGECQWVFERRQVYGLFKTINQKCKTLTHIKAGINGIYQDGMFVHQLSDIFSVLVVRFDLNGIPVMGASLVCPVEISAATAEFVIGWNIHHCQPDEIRNIAATLTKGVLAPNEDWQLIKNAVYQIYIPPIGITYQKDSIRV